MIIVLELLSRDVDIPVEDLHEVEFEVVNVRKGDTAHLCNVAVCVVSVIVDLRRHQDSRENEPENKVKKRLELIHERKHL